MSKGLRERKKLKLVHSIQRIALTLFATQGYDETSIFQIATQAEVSESTVYRYFATKEDLVLQDEYDPILLASIMAGSPGESTVASVRRAIKENLGPIIAQDPASFLLRGKLVLSTPSLRAHLWEALQANEAAMRTALAARNESQVQDFELRVAAGAIIGAMMAALTAWVSSDGSLDVTLLLDRALLQLEAGLA
jgi:AcrR family transcriptional regulator